MFLVLPFPRRGFILLVPSVGSLFPVCFPPRQGGFMGTCDLSLGHWLGSSSLPPAMREIWLGLVLEFGPAAAALHPVVDRHPLAHVLPIVESEHTANVSRIPLPVMTSRT